MLYMLLTLLVMWTGACLIDRAVKRRERRAAFSNRLDAVMLHDRRRSNARVMKAWERGMR